MRTLLAGLVLASLIVPFRGEAASMRCGSNLIADGATPSDARMKCGEPMSTHVRQESTSTKNRVREGKENSSTTQTVTVQVEEWTYNFGPNRLMQVVTFTDGKLTDVRSAGYGK
ncbi:DUF2845 domain-containing protein [Myxococcus qinghaiensis]|uniref:DUF2845 domain-containing protein n=1 Tax=Myxococcus qinghaiensis TaxID=2906758 RepID=UPI0020A790E5|nr:DUF2845 domain-containing protein [Myxococcus qinghaiensis]MCP3169541.1 DUF2845 domain-containing protein [Myxococcus qinghaiensis]